jgi:hydrogenase-4 membrane subunit HyfE
MSGGGEVIQQLTTTMSFVMVIMALIIAVSTTLKRMVDMYRAQAWVLTAIVLLTGLEPGRIGIAVAFLLALLPASLAVFAPWLLARASLTAAERRPAVPPGGRQVPPRVAAVWADLRGAPARAQLVWLQHGRSRVRGALSPVIDVALIVYAVLVTSRLAPVGGGNVMTGAGVAQRQVTTLAVSMALLLQGLFTMANKRDIIAQVIGLLVMEHGLFLAAVRIAPAELALLFVMSLYFYILITLTILVWILPALHRASASIEVADNTRLRG